MGDRRQRAQWILFVAAIIAPCAVLAGLGVRSMKYDQDLLGIRRATARRDAAKQAEGRLNTALSPILRNEIRSDLAPGQGYRYPETVLVGWAEGDRLALPWEPERDRVAGRCRALFSQPPFSASIRACDQAKSRKRQESLLSGCYERAITVAGHPAQAAYARWLWARDLSEAGQPRQAADLYRELLRTAPEVTDEAGVPLALLAAQSLAQERAERRAVASAVESVIAARPWLPPMSSYLVSEIVERLASDKDAAEDAVIADLRSKAAARIRLVDQADGLQQNDFASIRALLRKSPPNSWAAYGDGPWLIGAVEPSASATAIIVVRAQEILGRLGIPGAVRLSGASDPEGEILGVSFPGLKVVLSSDFFDPARDFQRKVLNFALILAVAATGFAAYLLWRDLRREMRLSELRTHFVSSVSHELKTPLTAIRMFAETLQMGRCADRETQAEYLGTIVNECERLSRLVDGVLLFSKTEQGKRTYRFKPMRAADAVEAAARALEYPLSQHGFRLHMKLRDDLPLVSADRDAIEQAVLNLLSNAMKYSDDSRDIELALDSEEGDVVIRVTDHGIGIAPEEHARIFEKFYRAATRDNQLIPGAGLGLALVAQIVKAHGGKVEVDSALGKGSVFVLRLPALAGGPGEEVTI